MEGLKLSELRDIRSLTLDELKSYAASIGQSSFRANQIYNRIASGAVSFDEFTNLSKELRERLKKDFILDNVQIIEKQVSKDDTIKILSRLADGCIVESVVMKYSYGYTICVSTQVGCNMKCGFCASGVGGLQRNLTAGEMTGQFTAAQNMIKGSNPEAGISRVVLMGSGEPLDNYDNVIKFIRLINDPNGIGIGQRNITLSTCGIVPKIYELAELNLQITLAVSLHAYDDDVRSGLMPVNRKYPISMLMKAVRFYFKMTKRRVTVEYALIKGENDNMRGAEKLANILKGTGVHVNLIPVNKVDESGMDPSSDIEVLKFQKILSDAGIETTVRRELGSDIDAACGQLRNKYVRAQSTSR